MVECIFDKNDISVRSAEELAWIGEHIIMKIYY